MRTRFLRFASITSLGIILMSSMLFVGCGQQANESANTNETSSRASGSTDVSNKSQENNSLINEVQGVFDDTSESVSDFFEERKNAQPIEAKVGEMVNATENLQVCVLSIEEGPYDSADKTATVKVSVSMTNLTNETLWVKASNWDADTSTGTRVDHKLWILDEAGRRVAESFSPARISPNSTFVGELYFDAEELKAVVYEPHWLLSAENQYIYFAV